MHLTDGTEEEAPLEQGDHGFLEATFSNGSTEISEYSNLLATTVPLKRTDARRRAPRRKPIRKKPACARAKKDGKGSRAAATTNANASEDTALALVPAKRKRGCSADGHVQRFAVLYYINGHRMALRQLGGAKRQIFSWGGKAAIAHGMNEKQLRGLGEQLVDQHLSQNPNMSKEQLLEAVGKLV